MAQSTHSKIVAQLNTLTSTTSTTIALLQKIGPELIPHVCSSSELEAMLHTMKSLTECMGSWNQQIAGRLLSGLGGPTDQ